MERSDRYKTFTGKLCANCQRPAAYIETITEEGRKFFHCDPDKGGCDTKWPVLSEKEIIAAFDKKQKMRVFSWRGEIDTLFSPNDSIRYYKSFLQSGLYSIDPRTGFVKAWVGGINFKHFQYDHVEQARRQGLRSHGFLGRDGGKLRALVDSAVIAPSEHTPRIQEIHIFLGHLLCQLLEAARRPA